MAILRHLSLNKKLKRKIVVDGGLSAVLRCAGSKNRDLQLQVSGVFANLSERIENTIEMVDQGCVPYLCELASVRSDEIAQDISRSFANILSNEENHVKVYEQHAFRTLVALTQNSNDHVAKRYAAMALRFMATSPEVRVRLVKAGLLSPFLDLAKSPLIDYQRTAAAALSSFSINEENKARLVKDGGLTTIIACISYNDLEVQRDLSWSLANLCSSVEYHIDIRDEGGIEALTSAGLSDDARVQRSCARSFSLLSENVELKKTMVDRNVLPTVYALCRSLDVQTMRYGCLTLANLASIEDNEVKERLSSQGIIRVLLFLARFPDMDVQRYACGSICNLGLGSENNKVRLVEEGVVRSLVDLVKFPDTEIQRCASLALTSIALSKMDLPKISIMQEEGLLPLLALAASEDKVCARAALYCLGCLAEHAEVKAKIVEHGAIPVFCSASLRGDAEIKRNVAYFFGLIAEDMIYHDELMSALDETIALASLEDQECQEMSAFTLAHLPQTETTRRL